MDIKKSRFFAGAKLMLQCLPFVLEESCFALKGGSAINFFFRDMPRLSVDIDLTYVPVEPREESLPHIEEALRRIRSNIQKQWPDARVQEVRTNDPAMTGKLLIGHAQAQIKVEPNVVIRGTVFPVEEHQLSVKAQEIFELFVDARTVSFADTFGGKLCAALDRQHPRDLFDVKLLLGQEGMTEEVRKGFLVYLISHDRPIHECLNPAMKEFHSVYEAEFQGMTQEAVSYDELKEVRRALVDLIKKILTPSEKDFLISFKSGDPDWSLLGVDGAQNLPAVQWKLTNIQKMDAAKRTRFVQKLKEVFS